MSFLNTSASKRGKKQDVSIGDECFETYVRDCLEEIRQGVETIKNNQAKFKEHLE